MIKKLTGLLLLCTPMTLSCMDQDDLHATWKRGCIVELITQLKDNYKDVPNNNPNRIYNAALKGHETKSFFFKNIYYNPNGLMLFTAQVAYWKPIPFTFIKKLSKKSLFIINTTTNKLSEAYPYSEKSQDIFIKKNVLYCPSQQYVKMQRIYPMSVPPLSILATKNETLESFYIQTECNDVSVWINHFYSLGERCFVPICTPRGERIFGLTRVFLEKNIAVGCLEKKKTFTTQRTWHIFSTEEGKYETTNRYNFVSYLPCLILTPLTTIPELNHEDVQNVIFTRDAQAIIVFLFSGKILKIQQLSLAKPDVANKAEDIFFKWK